MTLGGIDIDIRINTELIKHIISISLEHEGEPLMYKDTHSMDKRVKVKATLYCLKNEELKLDRDIYTAEITLEELELYFNLGINIE